MSTWHAALSHFPRKERVDHEVVQFPFPSELKDRAFSFGTLAPLDWHVESDTIVGEYEGVLV